MLFFLYSLAFAAVCPSKKNMTDIPFVVPATRWGKWSTTPETIQLKRRADRRWELWSPDYIRLDQGAVRIRVKLGKKPDMTLLVRSDVGKESENHLSGYGFSIEKRSLVAYRWLKGRVKPLIKKRKLPKVEIVDLHIEFNSNHMVFYACDVHNQLIESVTIQDSGDSGSRIVLRVHPAQDSKTEISNLSYRETTNVEPIPETYDIQGKRVFAELDRSHSKLRKYIIPNPVVPGIWALFPSRKEFLKAQKLGVEFDNVTGYVPKWAVKSNYRKWFGEPPEWTEAGYVLNRSYKDPRMIEDLLKGYHERFPDRTLLKKLGESRQGRSIWGLRITDNPKQDELEPAFFIVAAHHGNELLSVEYALDTIDRLLLDPSLKAVVNGLDIWVVPMLNVDGNENYWMRDDSSGRKNRWDINKNGVIESNEGVDLNRNYPFRWGSLGEKGSQSWIFSTMYRGDAPASEPETQIMLKLGLKYQPTALLSWHVTGDVILSSYTIDNATPLSPDIPWRIAEQLIKDIPPPGGKKRKLKIKRKLYSVDGVDQDWYLYNHGAMAYIIEGSYLAPEKKVRDTSVQAYRILTERFLKHALNGPAIRVVTENKAGEAIAAQITIAEVKTLAREVWKTRAHDGRWDFLVDAAGEYTITVEAKGYETVKKKVRTDQLYTLVLSKLEE